MAGNTIGYLAGMTAIGQDRGWRLSRARPDGTSAGVDRAGRRPPRVHPSIDRAAAYSWRILVIAALVVAALWLLGQLRVALFPVVVAVFLTRVLYPASCWLRQHG